MCLRCDGAPTASPGCRGAPRDRSGAEHSAETDCPTPTAATDGAPAKQHGPLLPASRGEAENLETVLAERLPAAKGDRHADDVSP